MNKFSIIIPTMQKNLNILNLLIGELASDDTIGEIILIDNSLKGFHFESDKVIVQIPEKNLYVNQSWNLGVSLAKFDYIGILNDDLILPENFCSQVMDFLSSDCNNNIGIIGLLSDSIINKKRDEYVNYPENSEIKFQEINKLDELNNRYWGSCIFGRKTSFYNIPKNLIINCGDDYLYNQNIINNKKNYAIYNSTIFHYNSLTSASKEFNRIKINDNMHYLKMDKNFKKWYTSSLKNKVQLNKFERIFSVKTINKYHKLLTICNHSTILLKNS